MVAYVEGGRWKERYQRQWKTRKGARCCSRQIRWTGVIWYPGGKGLCQREGDECKQRCKPASPGSRTAFPRSQPQGSPSVLTTTTGQDEEQVHREPDLVSDTTQVATQEHGRRARMLQSLKPNTKDISSRQSPSCGSIVRGRRECGRRRHVPIPAKGPSELPSDAPGGPFERTISPQTFQRIPSLGPQTRCAAPPHGETPQAS